MRTMAVVPVSTYATTHLVLSSVLASKAIFYSLTDCHAVTLFNHVPVQVMASVEQVVYVNAVQDGAV